MMTAPYRIEFYTRSGERPAEQPDALVEGTLTEVQAYAWQRVKAGPTVFAARILDADGSTVGGVSCVADAPEQAAARRLDREATRG